MEAQEVLTLKSRLPIATSIDMVNHKFCGVPSSAGTLCKFFALPSEGLFGSPLTCSSRSVDRSVYWACFEPDAPKLARAGSLCSP